MALAWAMQNSKDVSIPRAELNRMQTLIKTLEIREIWDSANFQRNLPLDHENRANLMKELDLMKQKVRNLEMEKAAYIQHLDEAKKELEVHQNQVTDLKLSQEVQCKLNNSFEEFMESSPGTSEKFQLFLKEQEAESSQQVIPNVSQCFRLRDAFNRLKSKCEVIDEDKELENRADCDCCSNEPEDWVPFEIDEDECPDFIASSAKRFPVVAEIHEGESFRVQTVSRLKASMIPVLKVSPHATGSSQFIGAGDSKDLTSSGSSQVSGKFESKLPVYQGKKSKAAVLSKSLPSLKIASPAAPPSSPKSPFTDKLKSPKKPPKLPRMGVRSKVKFSPPAPIIPEKSEISLINSCAIAEEFPSLSPLVKEVVKVCQSDPGLEVPLEDDQNECPAPSFVKERKKFKRFIKLFSRCLCR